jgi:hypothetical protein
MADYRELTKRWQYTAQPDGITAVRVFVDHSGGPASLPTLGDSHPDNADVLFYKYDKTKFGGHPTTNMYVCHYSSTVSSWVINVDENTSFSDLPRNGSASAEFKRLDNGQNFNWYGTDDAAGVPIFKRIITATLTIPKVFTSHSTLMTRIASHIGKLNDAAFEGQAAEAWLFSGSRHEEYTNSNGNTRWRAYFNFELRIVPGPGYHNHVYDPTTKTWRRLANDPYETEDFSTGVGGLFE